MQLFNNLSFLVIHPTNIRGPKSPKSETFTDRSFFYRIVFICPNSDFTPTIKVLAEIVGFASDVFGKPSFIFFINFLMAHLSKTAKNFDYNQNQFIVSL